MKHIATHASPPTLPQSSSVQQTLPQSSSVQQTLPQSSSVQQTLPQSSSVQQTLPQSSSVQQTLPQSSSVQQTLPQSSSVQQTLPQSSSVQQTLPQSSSVQQTLPQSSSVQQTLPQSSSVQQTLPQSSSVQQTLPQSSSVQQTLPQSSSVQQTLPQSSSVQQTLPQSSSVQQTLPQSSSVQQTLPQSPVILPKCSAPKKRTVNCSQCDLTLLAKNLRTHIRRHHTEKENTITPERHFQSQCIDEKIGIFAVEKAFLGQATPIHVIKNTWGPNYRSACELDQCILNAEFAHNTGILPFECCHVKSLSFGKLVDNPNVALTENSLSQLVQQKWFGEARKAQLLKLQQEANTAETHLSFHVTVGGPSTKHFISVFEPTMSYYSRMGRVMVAYNKKKNNWHCPCARPRQSCIHKATAKWHLFQIMPQIFKRVRVQRRFSTLFIHVMMMPAVKMFHIPPTLLLLKG